MIKIDIFYNQSDQVVGFEVKGHAMGPDRVDEYDLICCGVSVITLTAVNGLTDYVRAVPHVLIAEDGWLKLLLQVDEHGNILTGESHQAVQIDALLGSMVLGLESLARDHYRYIQLKKRRWTSC